MMIIITQTDDFSTILQGPPGEPGPPGQQGNPGTQVYIYLHSSTAYWSHASNVNVHWNTLNE